MGVPKYLIHRFGILMLIGVSLPALAAAQHHAGMAATAPAGRAAPIVMHAAPVVMHAAPVSRAVAMPGQRIASASAPRSVGRVQGIPTNVRATAPRTHATGVRTTHRGVNFSQDFGEVDFSDVPGLGFDFPHLAAISGNRHHHRGFFEGAPFFDSGFLFGTPSVIIEQPAAAPLEEQPQAEGTIASEGELVRRPRRSYDAEVTPAPAAEAAPQRDVEQFVLVCRDGGLLFAVAYSWQNGTLRYVTPDGIRRSIGRDALDLNATQQFNEQRGLDFHAPA